MAALLAAIPSPSTNLVHLGPFTIHVYGLCYAVAVLMAVAITRRRWVAHGGERELVYDVALWGFPAGIIGGRLYYLATTPSDSFDHCRGHEDPREQAAQTGHEEHIEDTDPDRLPHHQGNRRAPEKPERRPAPRRREVATLRQPGSKHRHSSDERDVPASEPAARHGIHCGATSAAGGFIWR